MVFIVWLGKGILLRGYDRRIEVLYSICDFLGFIWVGKDFVLIVRSISGILEFYEWMFWGIMW